MSHLSSMFAYAKNIKYATNRSVPIRFLHKNVPYFSQWESPRLAEDILNGKIATDDDPNWRSSGAKNKQEYHDWSWAGCGMACTKMVLAYQTGKAVPLATLGKKCATYGGYTMPLKESAGLIYKPYVRFVKNEFGWRAHIATHMPLIGLLHELSQKHFIIASVNPGIRQPNTTPKTKGGHLILLLGYDKEKGEIYFHNPSGISKQTQQYAAVSFDDFQKFFSGRSIVVTLM